MREINPRHAVPEGDMLKRNPVLKALLDDTVLDPLAGWSWSSLICFG